MILLKLNEAGQENSKRKVKKKKFSAAMQENAKSVRLIWQRTIPQGGGTMSMIAEKKPFFHAGRRELIAKTLMVLLQICLGTALASGFFLSKSSVITKISSSLLLVILFGISTWTCPDRAAKGE